MMYAGHPHEFHLEDASCCRCKETTFPCFPEYSLMFTRLDTRPFASAVIERDGGETTRGRNIVWPNSAVILLSFRIVVTARVGGKIGVEMGKDCTLNSDCKCVLWTPSLPPGGGGGKGKLGNACRASSTALSLLFGGCGRVGPRRVSTTTTAFTHACSHGNMHVPVGLCTYLARSLS